MLTGRMVGISLSRPSLPLPPAPFFARSKLIARVVAVVVAVAAAVALVACCTVCVCGVACCCHWEISHSTGRTARTPNASELATCLPHLPQQADKIRRQPIESTHTHTLAH